MLRQHPVSLWVSSLQWGNRAGWQRAHHSSALRAARLLGLGRSALALVRPGPGTARIHLLGRAACALEQARPGRCLQALLQQTRPLGGGR